MGFTVSLTCSVMAPLPSVQGGSTAYPLSVLVVPILRVCHRCWAHILFCLFVFGFCSVGNSEANQVKASAEYNAVTKSVIKVMVRNCQDN